VSFLGQEKADRLSRAIGPSKLYLTKTEELGRERGRRGRFEPVFETLGEESGYHLLCNWPNEVIYVPSPRLVQRFEVQQLVVEDLKKGVAIDEIAKRHHVTERQVLRFKNY
jgi:hypothetical protein